MYESVAFLSQLISTSLIEQNWTTSKVFVGIIEILTELHRVTHLHPLNRADWPAPAAQIRTVIETMGKLGLGNQGTFIQELKYQ